MFLAVRAGLRNLPRDLVEAARLGGAHPLRVTRSVIMPLAMPAILAGAALAFVTSIGNFGIPAMLGIPGRYTVLTTLIYQRLQGFGPRVLGEVAALALILAALAVVGLLLRALVVRRGGFATDGASAPLEPFRLGRGRVAGRGDRCGSLLVVHRGAAAAGAARLLARAGARRAAAVRYRDARELPLRAVRAGCDAARLRQQLRPGAR